MKIIGEEFKKISRTMAQLETSERWTTDDLRLQAKIDGFNAHHNSEKAVEIIDYLRRFALPAKDGVAVAQKLEVLLRHATNEPAFEDAPEGVTVPTPAVMQQVEKHIFGKVVMPPLFISSKAGYSVPTISPQPEHISTTQAPQCEEIPDQYGIVQPSFGF